MPKLIFTLIVAFLAPAVGGGQGMREKSPATAQTEQRKTEDAQRKIEEAQRKAQAIDILKGVVESAPDIEDLQTRVGILTGALDLLWKHDAAYARASFIKTATAWLDRYASDATPIEERGEIRLVMSKLLTAFARHDGPAATRLLYKFQKLLEDVAKEDSISPDEQISLARGSLDSDVTESTALAAKALEVGVPGEFSRYLMDLEKRDPTAATSLFRLALSTLSSGRVYNNRYVTILSAYAFRESQVAIPVPSGGYDGYPLVFGTMILGPLYPPHRDLNRALVAEYLAAAGAYLNAEATQLEQPGNLDPNEIGRCFFLAKKLRAYVDRTGLDGGQNWPLLDARYTMLAERVKITDRALSGLAEVAQRIVAEHMVARFDAGESAFAAAEKVRDAAERDELLVSGISQQIDEGKYAEATQKIAQLQDEKVREQLNASLAFRMAESSLKKLDWNAFNAQLNRVSDVQLRTYLVLSAALAASSAQKKKMTSDFLLTALSSSAKIEDVDARAAAIVATAGMTYATTEASWSTQALNDGVNAINRSSEYSGDVYGITLGAPTWRRWVPFPAFDLSQTFEHAAKRDWPGAIAAAQSIKSKALRSQAYVAACRSVL